jgi:hypothetical protein
MKASHLPIAVVLVSFLIPLSTSWAQSDGHRMIMPSDLKWEDVSSLPPGAKIAVIEGPMDKEVPFTVRIKFPPNYDLPAHWHPGTERVSVLQGTFYMGKGAEFSPKDAKPLGPGCMMIIQPKTSHFALTKKEEVIVQLHGTGPWGITYINPAEDPRKK